MASLLSEDLGRMHRVLQDTVSEEADASAEVARLEAELKAAQERTRSKRTALLAQLDELTKKSVTVRALEKSLIGVTVNGLRRHENERVAARSEALVRTWKTLVESASTWGSLVRGGGASGTPPAASSSASSRVASLAAGVLDQVRDERGRVERRRAHPDSHEDALALREAAEAERMWEEHMGGGRCADSSRGAEPDETARQAATHRLREHYRKIDETKRGREIVQLDRPPKALKHSRHSTPSAPAAARKPGSSVLSKLKQQASKIRP